jgi:hypothetical protein
MRWRKLRNGVYRQEALKQKYVKQLRRKTRAMCIYKLNIISDTVFSYVCRHLQNCWLLDSSSDRNSYKFWTIYEQESSSCKILYACVSDKNFAANMYGFFALPHSQYSYLQGTFRHFVNSIFRNLLENSLLILNCVRCTNWKLSLVFSYSNPNICSAEIMCILRVGSFIICKYYRDKRNFCIEKHNYIIGY